MSNDKDTKLEVLSNHYSETFSLLKSDVGKRDRLFLYMLIVIAFIFLYMSAPDAVGAMINSFVSSQMGNNNLVEAPELVNVSFIGALLWLALLSLSHTYFQLVLHIERQYDYVYQLESELSKNFDEHAFIREGKHYKNYKRNFSKWTKIIFWMLFPALYFLFIGYWLFYLFNRLQTPIPYQVINTLIPLSSLTSMAFYLVALFWKK